MDRVFLAMNAQSAHSAGSLEGFYVSASRGRLSCNIYTDAKEELRDAVQNSSARKAAIELLDNNSPTKTSYEHKPIRKPTTPLPTYRQQAQPPGC